MAMTTQRKVTPRKVGDQAGQNITLNDCNPFAIREVTIESDRL